MVYAISVLGLKKNTAEIGHLTLHCNITEQKCKNHIKVSQKHSSGVKRILFTSSVNEGNSYTRSRY